MLNEYNMQQQMIMQQQMMMQQQIQENQNQANIDNKSLNIFLRFEPTSGKVLTLSIKYGTRVYEALNQYIERTIGYPNDKIFFTYNAKRIDRNEPKTVEEFFNFSTLADIHVLGC